MADFWPKDMWPSSSPDLNLLDFAVWGTLERETNRTFHPNVNSLKAAIVKEWNNLSEKFIINSCIAFCRRVEAMIAAEGGHIEHVHKDRVSKFCEKNSKMIYQKVIPDIFF
uniref:Uncharacterized protein n=1 Tax=Lepeophtheirus salmonis TaxID=72036 RepID=A0A0K2VB12_LEPSM